MEELLNELYERIKHGDADHQKWLKDEIQNFIDEKKLSIFYRVSNVNSQQGLWYDQSGNFTGLIHDKFSFCKNFDLKMDFDEELVGWISAVPSLDQLYQWFTKEDILELQKHGYYIHKYETTEHKFYDRFQHHIINQNNSKIIEKIVIE